LKAFRDPILPNQLLIINHQPLRCSIRLLLNISIVFCVVEVTEKLSSNHVAWGEAGLLGELSQ